jgi:uncharacterized protein (TIGR02246 family)
MSTDVKAIKDALTRWVDAINARRADEISKLVTDNVVFIHPPAAPFAGRASIARLYRAAFQVYQISERLQYEDIRVIGALATARVTAHIQLRPSNGGTVFAEFIEVDAMRFRRFSRGEWKLFSRSLHGPSRLLAPFAYLTQRPAASSTSKAPSTPAIASLGVRHERPAEGADQNPPAIFIPSGALPNGAFYHRLLTHG